MQSLKTVNFEISRLIFQFFLKPKIHISSHLSTGVSLAWAWKKIVEFELKMMKMDNLWNL